MNTIDGTQRPISTLTLDGLDTTTTALADLGTGALMVNGTNQMAAQLNMGGFSMKNLLGGTANTDAISYSQLAPYDTITARTAADATVTSAFIAADTVVTNARIAGDATVTTNYIAADTVVTNASVQKTGSALTGGLTWSGVSTPIQAVNTGALTINFGAGTVASPMPTTLALASNVVSILSFKDLVGITKAFIRYSSDPGVIDISVSSVSMLTINNTTVTLGGTLACGGNRITGMGDPTADTDAATRLYVTNLMVAEVNSRVASVGAEATTRAAQDAAVIASSLQKSGGTMTGDLIMNGGNINMGTGYMAADLNMGTHKITGVTAGTVSTDAVNYGQTMLRDGTNAMTAQLYMGNFRIGNLSPALSSLDAVNYGQTVLRDGTNAMTGILNMGLNIISNCGPASSPTDVVTYTQITNKFVPITGGAAAGQAMTGHLYMGTNRISGCGVAVSAADVVVYSQIQQSTIPLTAWRVGETVQRKWYSPELSNNLSNSTCAASSNVVVVTINMNVTSGNKIFINGQFNIDANDQFTMRAGFSTQYTDYVNQPTTVNFRDRTYNFHALFIPSSSGSKTISWKIFNESTSGTLTISTLNWLFSIEEVQS